MAALLRFMDVVLAALALVVFAIPMVIIAFMIRRYDKGPVFFVQTRIGKGCKPFRIFKFRSMKVGDAAFSAGETAGDQDKQAARQRFQTTERNDRRITPIGKIIRRTHLDELPQLLNVIRGDMSLVGVRPDTPSQEVDYSPSYWQERHRLRPGITGLAQIHSSDINLATRTELEQEWLSRPSLANYFGILFATLAKVMKGNSF